MNESVFVESSETPAEASALRPAERAPGGPSHRRVAVDGARLECVEWGRGESVVMVHGALGDYRVWSQLADRLGATHRAIAYSRRGHHPEARSPRAWGYTRRRHADDLVAVIEALDAGPTHLVGHSYGGAVAAIVAAERPDLVRSLVLAEPSIFGLLDDDEEWAALGSLRARFGRVLEALARGDVVLALQTYSLAVCGEQAPNPPSSAAIAVFLENLHTLRPMLETYFEPSPFTRELARSVRAPVLSVGGEHSPGLYRHVAAGLEALVPNCRTVTLAGASHGLHLERPDGFFELLREFLGAIS